MLQELFRIPYLNLPVYGYGLMLVIALLAAVALARFLAVRAPGGGINPDDFTTAGYLALFTGVAGARVSHVLENFSYYTNPKRSFSENLFDAVNISSGGLTYYGGFIAAFVVLLVFARWKRIPIRIGMDIAAPCLMVGLGFGRIGCLLNGCCYGATCTLPWAITFPYGSNPYVEQFERGEIRAPMELMNLYAPSGPRPLTNRELAKEALLNPEIKAIAAKERSLPVHPAQIYSTITAWLLAALLTAYFFLPHAPGRVIALMMILEGSGRFLLESLRVEPAVLGRMSLSMVIGLGCIGVGILLWVVFGLIHRPAVPAPESAPAPAATHP
jgi:phosphatidylglycerol---prolipoprotein diacylglyceryl transferase